MKIVEAARKVNRTLLEMHIGILFLGVLCQAVGAVLVTGQKVYAASLWLGILLALAGSVHMYRTLDRALDFDEKSAAKLITRGYLIRYALFVVILAIVMVTGVLNPLIVFMGYMSLKVTAYLQPITHKICNKIFHEKDPVPEALCEEDLPMEREEASGDAGTATKNVRR